MGGNLANFKDNGDLVPGWTGLSGKHQAEDLNLELHSRTKVRSELKDLLQNINVSFQKKYNQPIWSDAAFNKGTFLGGSSFHFFNTEIPDTEFLKFKKGLGDIDTQAPIELDPKVKEFLTESVGQEIGNATFIGFKPGNNQYTSMWNVPLGDTPVKLQIDFEFGPYDPKTNQPDEWYAYSHSSHWDDIRNKIKGVFHKYINRAIPYTQTSTKYVARVLKRSTKISEEPVTDSDFSFAVSGNKGGGLSLKYIPYIDPETSKPAMRNGIPVMQLLDTKDRHYDQNISSHFEKFFGYKPSKEEHESQNSFTGTVGLIAKNYNDTQKTEVVNRFIDICFEQGSQMITKNDPQTDRKEKFSAINYMLTHINLPESQVKSLHQRAIDMSQAYEHHFYSKKQ